MIRSFVALAFLAALVAVGAAADTLILTDGSQLQGELVGVDEFYLYFTTSDGVEGAVAISHVRSITLDWTANPEPRIGEGEWLSAMAKARHALEGCRSAKWGVVLGGLVFIGGGWWLGNLGYGEFGELLMGLGAVATLLGVVAPSPTCAAPLHRVAILTRIGLEHGWIY
ncbi:hypothetical protein LR090_07470 [Candidatus Bipolaricaulota bacterium]|nr:hypothetical protein [Candidatus Bipolaricaulota bacterium]